MITGYLNPQVYLSTERTLDPKMHKPETLYSLRI